MGLLDDLGGIVDKFQRGAVSDGDVHSTYDQVSREVPTQSLAVGLGQAFRSDQTPPFEQMVGQLFRESNPSQKAGLLNQLLNSLGPGEAEQLLTTLGLTHVAGTASAGEAVTPQQAQQVPPAAAQAIAKQAEKKDPTIVDQAASFYAQHPTLVKAIGAGALALLMSRISSARR
jgi:hypothetical protein